MSQVILDRYYEAYAARLERQRQERESRNISGYRPKIIRVIRKPLAKGKDAKIGIAGEGGSGKSTLALRLGEEIKPTLYVDQPDFAIDKAVHLTASQYMNGVQNLESNYPPPADPLERTVQDYDEPGQSWYHRQFMSEASQILARTMIGVRWKRFVTTLSIPNLDLLEVDGVRLLNWFIWVPDQGIAEVYRVMPQKFGGDPWFKSVINTLRFTKPRAALWHPYEKKKFSEQDALYEKYGRKLEHLEAPKLTVKEIVDLVKKGKGQDGKEVNFYKKGKLNVWAIQKEFNVGLTKTYLIKEHLEPDEGDEKEPVRDSLGSDSAEDLLRQVTEDADVS